MSQASKYAAVLANKPQHKIGPAAAGGRAYVTDRGNLAITVGNGTQMSEVVVKSDHAVALAAWINQTFGEHPQAG